MKVKLSLVLLFCLNLLYNDISAQQIEKEVEFRYESKAKAGARKPDTDLSTVQDRPFLLNMVLVRDSIVKVNSFLPAGGSLFENGKRLDQSSLSSNLITATYATPDLKYEIYQAEKVIINFTENPASKYEFRQFSQGNLVNTFPVSSASKFLHENPSLSGEPNPFPFELVQEGSGFAKSKNANLVLNKINYTFKASGFGKFENTESKVLVNPNEWKAQTKNLYLTERLKFRAKLAENTYVALVNRVNPEDNYWTSKNFALIVFDGEGKVIKIHQIDFEFLRGFNSGVKVLDETGNQKGLLVSFENDSEMAGQGKKKDPVRNKFNLFYINNAGEIEMKVDLIHGANPEKDDYFLPSFAILKNGQLNILNRYSEYSLRKNISYIEKLVVDKTGKVSAENLETNMKVAAGLHSSWFSMENPVYFNGAFYSANTHFNTAFDGVKTYINSNVSKMNADLTSPEMVLALHKGPQKDPIVSSLEIVDGRVYAVVAYAGGNQVLNVSDNGKPLEIKYEDYFQPFTPYLSRNYVVDYKAKKLFFVLEGKDAGLARLVKVGL